VEPSIPDRPDTSIVGAASTIEAAIRRYDRLSGIYHWNARFGASASRRAIALLDARRGERVVEIGVGTGRDLVLLRDRVGAGGRVVGVDLSMGMLRQARRRLRRNGAHGVALERADARALPIADRWADLVFCSRVLDLVETSAISAILGEFRRLLRPGGRLAVVHMSKPDANRNWFERLYGAGLGFGGGLFVSRPVLAAPFFHALGFVGVERRYLRGLPGSEIVIGRLPAL
jgi:demethylmenaquinone methyltransferase/2-methoxy-6-polyprenyl-1,4-benzoquinol methylase